MDVAAQPLDIPPPSYQTLDPRLQSRAQNDAAAYLGPPPAYSSQEDLWTALQQTDADGSSTTSSLELPPSYEEVIAGLAQESTSPGIQVSGATALSPSAPVLLTPQGMTTRHSWHGAILQPQPERLLVHIPRPQGPPNRGYGFAFRDGRVTVVLPNSAAQQVGLTEGSRLVAINGVNVEGRNKEFICAQIRAKQDGVSLMVETPGPLALLTWHTLTLKKADQGYGFAFRGLHVSVVLPGSEAAQAGLQVGDTLHKINGFSTAGRDRARLLELINLDPQQVKVTVSRRGAPNQNPYEPSIFYLRRSPFTGFGFAFRGTRVSALLPGSEAERTGLRIGDRILEINHTPVIGLSKNEMLRLINSNQDVVMLVVLSDASPIGSG